MTVSNVIKFRGQTRSAFEPKRAVEIVRALRIVEYALRELGIENPTQNRELKEIAVDTLRRE